MLSNVDIIHQLTRKEVSSFMPLTSLHTELNSEIFMNKLSYNSCVAMKFLFDQFRIRWTYLPGLLLFCSFDKSYSYWLKIEKHLVHVFNL
jgi:hypothetical protein